MVVAVEFRLWTPNLPELSVPKDQHPSHPPGLVGLNGDDDEVAGLAQVFILDCRTCPVWPQGEHGSEVRRRGLRFVVHSRAVRASIVGDFKRQPRLQGRADQYWTKLYFLPIFMSDKDLAYAKVITTRCSPTSSI
jgi:hypothetical protein